MKKKPIFLTIAIFASIGFLFTQNAYGNPIPVSIGESPLVRIFFMIGMFFLGVLIEYGYFKSRISKIYGSTVNINYLLFLRVNLVTFPLTQLFAYFVYIYFSNYFLYYVLLIEIGVVFTESVLLRIEFQKSAIGELSPAFIIRNTIWANLLSFLLGLLSFIPSLI